MAAVMTSGWDGAGVERPRNTLLDPMKPERLQNTLNFHELHWLRNRQGSQLQVRHRHRQQSNRRTQRIRLEAGTWIRWVDQQRLLWPDTRTKKVNAATVKDVPSEGLAGACEHLSLQQ